MLFKRVLQGKSTLSKSVQLLNNSGDTKQKEVADKTQGACNNWEDSNFIEEIMRVALTALGLWTLWIGLSYSSTVLPYPFNFIVSADIMYPPPVYDYPFPSAAVLAKLPPVKEKHLNLSLSLGKSTIDMMQRLEENLAGAGMMVEQATPEHGLVIQGYPSDEAMLLHKWSWTITKASFNIAHNYCGKYGVSPDECGTYVSTFNLGNTEMGARCVLLNHPKCSASRIFSKYRSFDGSCNNAKRGSLGKAMTGFKRLLHPKYADGIDEARKTSYSSIKPLPPARTVSAALVKDMDLPDGKHTQTLAHWTQFLENDLIHIPIRKMIHTGNTITCCDRWGRSLAPRHQHPSCMALTVSKKDPFYSKHRVTCLPYVRSVTTFRSDCTFGAAEQMNQASHFLDGSSIYGSNKEVALSLREKTGGLLKTQEKDGQVFPPQVEHAKEKCQVDSDSDVCFKAGDIRVNSHPHLTALHTLWLREHNRVATAVSDLNPTWNDEQLFQEARRIIIAQIQHITYSHWLPAITGLTLNESQDAYDISYNSDLDPTVSNAFASTGLRFVNTLMEGTIELINEDGTVNASLDLMNHFNNPGILAEPSRMHQVLRGMATRKSQTLDFNLPDDLTEKLYAGKKELGLDILSLDIQRGRDHGLPPYHQYRVLCGLNRVNSFDDFSDSISSSTIDSLKKWYTHPYDVDLVVGAMAEKPIDGGVVGPTFACLLSDQLSRTRSGDRYFYSNIEQPEPFSQHQLKQIRKASLARLICDNAPGLKEIQADVFSTVSVSNPIVSCDVIKKLNLVAWQDALHKPDLITRTKMNVDKWIKHKD